MTAQSMGNGSGWDFDGMNYGTKASQAFYEKHKKLLIQCRDLVDAYIMDGNGDALLLLDASFLALVGRVRDALAARGVEVRGLPPSIGDELSKKLQ